MTGHGGFVHASVVVLGEAGIFIEGASGSGKSSLAAALVTEAVLFRCFGRLVGDDRVHLSASHGRLIGRPHPALAGLIERRGAGLVAVPHEPACVIALVVALVEVAALPPRHPAAPPTRTLEGITLPLLALSRTNGVFENSRRVFAALTLRQPVAAELVQGAC